MGEEGEGRRGNCTCILANMAEEEVAKLIVGNDSGMCKASFADGRAKDVFIDQEQFLCVKRDEERDEDEKRERHVKRDRDENRES